MIQLLKIEWLKLNRYRAFYLLAGLFVVSIFGINYVTYQATQFSNPMAATVLGRPFQFPGVWNTISYFASFLLLIPGLIMILITTNEYTFRTHRQNIIDGLSRSQFILTKITMVAIIAFCSTLLVSLMAFLFGIFEKGSVFSFSGFEYIFYFFVQALAYVSVALLLALLFKRAGIAIGIYFLYTFVLENMIAALLNHYIGTVGNFLPLESGDKLIPIPFMKGMTGGLMPVKATPDALYLLITSLVWIALCLWFCKYRFEKNDL